MVSLLSNSPLDHHSRLISHAMPDLVTMGVPALEKYFDRRKFRVGVSSTIDFGKLRIKNGYEFTAEPSTMMQETEETIAKSFFHPQAKEQSLKMEILDLPLVSQKADSLHLLTDNPLAVKQSSLNSYEIHLVKGFANTENTEIF